MNGIIVTFCIIALLRGAFSDECIKSSGGLEATCVFTFDGQKLSFTIKLETCREKPNLKFNLKIDALGIDWKETFEDSKEVAIPGLPIAGASIYLKTQLKSSQDGAISLKMQLFGTGLYKDTPPVTIYKDTIAKSDCNAFLYWWNSQVDGVKAGVAGGGALLLILLIACCCKCCCCNKKEARSTNIVMSPQGVAPSNNIVVSNNSSSQQMSQFPPQQQPPAYMPQGFPSIHGSKPVPYEKM